MQGIPIRQIACGDCHTVILQDDNDVLVFGANDHTIILQDNSNVLVFGRNDYGQLGLGHNDHQNRPVNIRAEAQTNLPSRDKVTLMQNVAQLHGYYINSKWSSENHYQFSATFRNRILFLVNT